MAPSGFGTMIAERGWRVNRSPSVGSGVAGDDGARSLPEAVPIRQPRDWRLPDEREHARAERERARA